jgi:hypothetical protein
MRQCVDCSQQTGNLSGQPRCISICDTCGYVQQWDGVRFVELSETVIEFLKALAKEAQGTPSDDPEAS